jgi:hydroxymethylpyrimidine pyrophosphatase-like HAD family hydrolase
LVHLRDLERTRGGEQPGVRRALARAMQRYFAARYLDDLSVPVGGEWVALDIDGVLEGSLLGFAAPTPASVLTLRALNQHGYRTVLATGRSLDEVRERCRSYRLAGGVAEYGAVVYDASTDRWRSLLTDAQRADLAHLRSALGEMEGIRFDSDYQYTVRAYRLDAMGHRRGLSADEVKAALAGAGVGERVRSIPGQAQTDFMAGGIDKGAGLRALAVDLSVGAGPDGKWLALAVGDTVSDLPMLALARQAYAPAHADDELRTAGVARMSRPYQAGLALAAGRLLGHRPGGCPLCRAPDLSSDSRLLLTLLGASEAGPSSMLRAAVRLAISAWLT